MICKKGAKRPSEVLNTVCSIVGFDFETCHKEICVKGCIFFIGTMNVFVLSFRIYVYMYFSKFFQMLFAFDEA